MQSKSLMQAVVLVVLALAAETSRGQNKAPVTQSATQSPCANDTVEARNATSVNIRCSGLTPEQQKLMRNIPDLLNKLLTSQKANNYELLSKMDSCIDEAAIARRSAAAIAHGATTTYNFDGSVITIIDHTDGQDRVDKTVNAEPLFEYNIIKSAERGRRWDYMITYCESVIKERPDWLTPYLFEAEADLNLGRFDAAVPLLKHVRDESGGNAEYSDATKWLSQLSYSLPRPQ